jgi:hypothetical protein
MLFTDVAAASGHGRSQPPKLCSAFRVLARRILKEIKTREGER